MKCRRGMIQILRSVLIATLPVMPMLAAPGTGRILVATDMTADADFARTVVLIVYTGDNGVVGLMLNRPTDVPVQRLFPGLGNTRSRTTAFAGGPLALGINALCRSKTAPQGARAVAGGIWLLPEKEAIEATLKRSPDQVRIYIGQCGWTRHQLDAEIAKGLWSVSLGDPDLVFDSTPETLWKRLSARLRR